MVPFSPFNAYMDDPLDYGELSDSKKKLEPSDGRNKTHLPLKQNKRYSSFGGEENTMSTSAMVLPEIVEYNKPFQLPPYESDNLNRYISKQIDLIRKDQVPAANR